MTNIFYQEIRDFNYPIKAQIILSFLSPLPEKQRKSLLTKEDLLLDEFRLSPYFNALENFQIQATNFQITPALTIAVDSFDLHYCLQIVFAFLQREGLIQNLLSCQITHYLDNTSQIESFISRAKSQYLPLSFTQLPSISKSSLSSKI